MTVSDNENIDSETTETLTIRCMELGDLDEVIKMCIDEFGSGPSVGPGDFPWSRPQSIPEWWDRVYFEPSVRMALKAKLRNNSRMSRKKKDIIESRVEDPAILVLCREQGKKASVDVVGLVEISLQPPEADKNPPTYPNPLGLKEFYSRLKGLKLQGWVTNLLVDPECRGLGYSKLLMLATEGVARSWNRDYIYLHADADYKSGRIPQSLYEGMGYEVVADEDPEYKWMPKSTFSSIQMVEGVPLLFFRKRL
jgi:ribosomal protein S18 acetylase RimI-like enzyme